MSKVRSEFYGIELIEPTETPLVEEVVTPVVEEVKEVVVVMSDYERMCLELKEKKMEQARMMQETRLMEQKKMEETRLMEQKKMEERKLALKQSEKEKDRNLTKELELMKIQFKSECFNKSMEFQKEVNNHLRFIKVDFAQMK